MKKLLAVLLTACVFLSCLAVFSSAEEEGDGNDGFIDGVLKYEVTFEDGGLYNFTAFCDPDYTVQEGDYLVYAVLLDQGAIDAYMGSIDINYNPGNKNARDAQIEDSEGVNIHPKYKLDKATPGEWYSRTIPLDKLAGSTLTHIMLPCHPRYDEDVPGGTYTAYYNNIYVLNSDDEIVCTIFEDTLDEAVVNTSHTANQISATLSVVDIKETFTPEQIAFFDAMDKIGNLSNLNLDKTNAKEHADEIAAARAAFDALSDEYKLLLPLAHYHFLEQAEAALAEANETDAGTETSADEETQVTGNDETAPATGETEAGKAPETEKPADGKKGGCGSVLAFPALALLGTIGLAVPALYRKKD